MNSIEWWWAMLLRLTSINADGSRDGELADLQSTVTLIVFADHEIIFVKSDESDHEKSSHL